MILRAFLLVVLAAAAAVSGLAQAQQYRWVDQNGKSQFSDTPPPGAKDVRKTNVTSAKPGQYDPSGLIGPAPKPGQYGIPGEGK